MASPIGLSPLKAEFTVHAKGLKQLKEIEAAGVQFMKKMGAGMQKTGRFLSASVTAPVVAAGLASTKFAMDFNKGMANVGTLIPGQRDKLEGFKTSLIDLAKASGTSTDVLTDGLYQTISALGDTPDAINQLTAANKAAKAGGASTKDAIDLLAMVTKNYGDTSAQAMTKVSDLGFMAVKLGVTTFPELAASMGSVSGAANTLGVSQEELFASYATLTGVTGNTSEVSTQLSAILGGMIKPTEGMQKLTKKLGYESAAAMVQEEGFTKTLQILQEQTGGSVAKLGKLFESKEALRTLLPLLGAQSQSYTEKLAAMQDASGATSAALKEQEEGINKTGHEFEKAKQALVTTAIRIGDRLLPVVTKLTDKLVPLLDKITSLSDSQLEFGLKIAGFAALAGPAIWALGSLTTSIMALRDGYLLLKTATQVANLSGAATDAQKLAGGFEAADKKLGVLGSNMNKLGAVMGVAAVAAAGVAIGTMISQAMQYVDDQAREAANKRHGESLGNVNLTDEQLKQKQRSIEIEKEKMQRGAFSGNFRKIKSTFGFTGEQEKLSSLYSEQLQISEILKQRAAPKLKQAEMTTTGFFAAPQLQNGVTQSVDLNIKIDAPDGAKVGVNSKGGNPKVQNKRGGIMQPGMAI